MTANRTLLAIPPAWLNGSAPIGPGYPKQYTRADFARTSQAINNLNDVFQRFPPDEARQIIDQWRHEPPGSQGHETAKAYDKLYQPGGESIRADYDPQTRRLELENGSHRVHYAREDGVDLVPVWVQTPDRASQDEVRSVVEREAQNHRPGHLVDACRAHDPPLERPPTRELNLEREPRPERGPER